MQLTGPIIGGRNRYNRRRAWEKWRRRGRLLELLRGLRNVWGLQSELARELGVSRATLCRDMKAVGAAQGRKGKRP
jgi:hypothetical protein